MAAPADRFREILLASVVAGPQNAGTLEIHPSCMNNRLRKLVAWTLLTQVLLVGSLGTGLHGLFGCEHGLGSEHGPSGACASSCCVDAAATASQAGCHDCAFCRCAIETNASSGEAPASFGMPAVSTARCDGCAVCDLLAQYHSVTPFEIGSLAIELAAGEAPLQRQNAALAASSRLALSRGPPAA